MQDKDLAALKVLAEKAMGWSWETVHGDQFGRMNEDGVFYDIGTVDADQYAVGEEAHNEVVLNFIAATTPAAILSLIASHEQQAARIAELEARDEYYRRTIDGMNAHYSEAVASPFPAVDLSGLTRYGYYGIAGMRVDSLGDYLKLTDVQALLAAPARDVGGLTDERREAVRDAIAEALGEAYDCTRVWSAWGYGTMGPSDFSLVAEDGDRLNEITDAVCEVLATKEAEPVQAEALQALLTRIEEAALNYGRMGAICEFEGQPMIYASTLLEIDELASTLATSPAPSASQGGVKEGWQLVPKQMTVAMALALHGREGIEQGPGITCVSDETARLYDAMLSAAPSVTDGEGK